MRSGPSMQNTSLNKLGGMVRKSICDGAREAGVFSVLVDETKDCSNNHQPEVCG